MAIGLEEKKAIVAEVNETAASALSLVIADARGVASNDMTALRATARENQIHLRVVRNTLAKRALEGTDYECVTDTLVGPSIFGFSMEDPGAAARLFKDFARDNGEFEVKALSVSGKLLGADQLDVLAKLPTREQALASLMSVMQAGSTAVAFATASTCTLSCTLLDMYFLSTGSNSFSESESPEESEASSIGSTGPRATVGTMERRLERTASVWRRLERSASP